MFDCAFGSVSALSRRRCLPPRACAPLELRFGDDVYDLRSLVAHLGTDLNSGHYLAIARHDTDNGRWWLYNDKERKEATDAQRSTLTCFRDYRSMKSYVMFYEKRTA